MELATPNVDVDTITFTDPWEEAFALQKEIKRLDALVRQLRDRREVVVNTLLASESKSDRYEIQPITKTSFVVNVPQFFARFPAIAQRIAKIQVGDAKDAIGKEGLESVSDKVTTTTYKVIESLI